ncbi:hypothetical protein Tco_0540653 [Tanacetum coccineum]
MLVNTISDLYKGLNIITELLKEIKNVVKDDSFTNKKIIEATESFTKFCTNIADLQSSVNTLQAHALKQDEELATWAKSSTNMAWNLGSRLSDLERAQNHIQPSMSYLKEDTHSIKNMITEMCEVFKGHSSGNVTPTLALTHIPANVEGENTTNTATKDPPSYTEGETREPKRAIPISTIQPTQAQLITAIITHPESSQAFPKNNKGKGIATECPKVYNLTAKQLQEQMDKEELIKKAGEEARLLAISKPEVIKVVQEEAEKIGLDPRKIASAKAGEKFKKARDAEHRVLKREHTEKIHPNTKLVVITVYRGTDGKNFDVHRPFAFGAFALPALKQGSPQSSRKKRKHMELEPETKTPGLECNQTLLENVSFVNNMVIEEPEMEALVSYLVAASMVKSHENARFSLKLKKLIVEHPDQEKLKSKKFKLEALGYEMN